MTFTNGKPFPSIWFKQNNQCLNNKCPHFGKPVLLQQLSWACLGQTQLAWVSAFTSSLGLMDSQKLQLGDKTAGSSPSPGKPMDSSHTWGHSSGILPMAIPPKFFYLAEIKKGPCKGLPGKKMRRGAVNLEHWILEECDSRQYKLPEVRLLLEIIE